MRRSMPARIAVGGSAETADACRARAEEATGILHALFDNHGCDDAEEYKALEMADRFLSRLRSGVSE